MLAFVSARIVMVFVGFLALVLVSKASELTPLFPESRITYLKQQRG